MGQRLVKPLVFGRASSENSASGRRLISLATFQVGNSFHLLLEFFALVYRQ